MAYNPNRPNSTIIDGSISITGTLLATLGTSIAASILTAHGHSTAGWHVQQAQRSHPSPVFDSNTHSYEPFTDQVPVGTIVDYRPQAPWLGKSIRLQMPDVPNEEAHVHLASNVQLEIDRLAAETAKKMKETGSSVVATFSSEASGEWGGDGPNAGSNKVDPGNIHIAKNYEDITKQLFVEALQRDGQHLNPNNIHISYTEERFTKDQQLLLHAAAKSQKFASVAELIAAYKQKPARIAKPARAFLKSVIEDKQQSHITTEPRNDGPLIKYQATEFRTDEGCYTILTTTEHTEQQGGNGPIVICFVPVLWARRRNDVEEILHATTQARKQALKASRAAAQRTRVFINRLPATAKPNTPHSYSLYRRADLPVFYGGYDGALGYGLVGLGQGAGTPVRRPKAPIVAAPKPVVLPETNPPLTVEPIEILPVEPVVAPQTETNTASEAEQPKKSRQREFWLRNYLLWPLAGLVVLSSADLTLKSCDADSSTHHNPTARPNPSGNATPTVAPTPVQTAPVCGVIKQTVVDGRTTLREIISPGVPLRGVSYMTGPFQPVAGSR